MKLFFSSICGIEDRSYWSGTPYFMAKHLQTAMQDGQFAANGPLNLFSQPFREKKILYRQVFKQDYLAEFEPLLSKCLSNELDRSLRIVEAPDFIVSPGCFPYPNAFLQSQVPTVFWADATFSNLLELFPEYKNLCNETIWCGQKLQQLMIDRATLCVFASQWAADSARRNYSADESKIAVIPYGANLHFTLEDSRAVEDNLASKDFSTCKLVLVARQWREKSGDFALAVRQKVEDSGLPCKLLVAGCEIPENLRRQTEDVIEHLPTVVKDSGGLEQDYVNFLSSGHFLLHPSTSTCFGIGMCEANSWAVPVLARAAGGAASVIENGENGYLFEADSTPDEFAQKITSLFMQKDNYLNLCRRTWRRYAHNLNWTASCQELLAQLQELH